jgi:16S rRNA (cytidine1402-2'-O)-methyltransferase
MTKDNSSFKHSSKPDHALYIVATPIGNLADISYRAIEVLGGVDIIAAEDTEKLRHGESVALISDAGTPLISDPGYRLVREAREQGTKVVPVPGACALITALCASGMPSDRFAFEGFPPAKSAARKAIFESVASEERSVIFYESPHRIMESLADMEEVFGAERHVALARELTKSFETFLMGSLGDVSACLRDDPDQRRGEMVIIIHGYQAVESDHAVSFEMEKAMKILLEELPLKKAAAVVARIYGGKKNKLYKWALDNGLGDD